MKRGYVYRRPVKRSHYGHFRRQMFITLIFIAAFAAVGYYIYSGLHHSATPSATSQVENIAITGNKQTFTNDYFQFDDTGTWVVDKHSTTANKIVYDKFRKNQILAVMIIYINQVPIPLYLATPLVLPVRIINDNSLQGTQVSRPCGTNYAKGELHRVKETSIDNATLLCDPDSTSYKVVLSEINGNYQLHLKRPSGQLVQFVIVYEDDGISPQPDSIMNIANSFRTR